MRTLSALFDSRSDATDAIVALQASGIPANQISLLSWEGEEEEGRLNSPVAVGAFCGVGIGVLLLVGNVTIPVPLNGFITGVARDNPYLGDRRSDCRNVLFTNAIR